MTIQPRPRSSYIGGPDLASILGVSPYAGPYDVYLRKVEGAEIQQNAPMEWGLRLEDAVAHAFEDHTGHKVTRVTPHTCPNLILAPHESGLEWSVIHPQADCIGGTLDFVLSDDANALLECKTAAEDQLRQTDEQGQPLWGEPGTDEVPIWYLVQCQVYMGLTGRRLAHLAVFFLGAKREFRIYQIRFDPDLYSMVLERGIDFWQNHVIPKIPPPIDLIPSDMVTTHLARRAQDGGAVMEIPADLMALAADLEDAGRRRGEIEDREDALKAFLVQAMATLGAQKLQGSLSGAKFSLAIRGGGAGKPVTDYRGIALHLAQRLGLQGIPNDLEADFTKPGNPKKPYLMPYFTAVRNAIKKAAGETPTQLSA